jgi:hypothetical protein
VLKSRTVPTQSTETQPPPPAAGVPWAPHITRLAPCPRGRCKARARAFQSSRMSRHSPNRAASNPPACAPLASPHFDSRRPVHGLLHNPCESTCSRTTVVRCDFDGRHRDPVHGHLHCPRENVFAPGYAGEVLQSQSTAIQHLARACRDSPLCIHPLRSPRCLHRLRCDLGRCDGEAPHQEAHRLQSRDRAASILAQAV